VNDDNGFGVPAGWYPDPLGLPQMRWWDNHGWTEHTTEARAPIVIQEAKLAWADDDPAVDELPTRREMRERERETGSDDGSEDGSAPNADALLQLEGPSWDTLPADEPAPSALPIPEFVPAGAAQAVQDAPASAQQSTPVAAATAAPAEAAPQVAVQPEAVQPAASVQPEYVQQGAATATPAATATVAHAKAPSPNTPGGWVIALLPLAQLVGTLLVVASAGSGGTNVAVVLSLLIAPYFVSIPFAVADQRALRRHGYDRAASWAWVLFSAPIYLIARAIRIVMRAGNGFGPVLVWGALVLLQVGSIIAVPGLVISALPQVFSDQAAQSIQQSATVFGPITTVKCPTPPATVMGQQFTCTLYRIGSGQTYKVTASLQRQNGWIGWPVIDWGDYSLSR
jgi:hypothetical protein